MKTKRSKSTQFSLQLAVVLMLVSVGLAVPAPDSTAAPTITTLPSSASTASPSAACVTMAPGKNGYIPPEACNSLWNYSPSFAGAIIMSVIFGILSLVHLIQMIVYKKWFCWVIAMGAAWECAGFVLRAAAAKNQASMAFAIVSQLLILLAPLCKLHRISLTLC
jgi:hypothetical protein